VFLFLAICVIYNIVFVIRGELLLHFEFTPGITRGGGPACKRLVLVFFVLWANLVRGGPVLWVDLFYVFF